MELDVLNQAAKAFQDSTVPRPEVDRVVEALLQAEKNPQQYTFDQLIGEWRLCFATGTRKVRRGGIQLKKGYYLPKFAKAQISFMRSPSNQARIGNLAQLGSLRFELTGCARFQSKKNLLAFDFTQMQVRLGLVSLYSGEIRGGKEKEAAFEETSIAKLPFFAFFQINPDWIAARGRGGGLALWVKS